MIFIGHKNVEQGGQFHKLWEEIGVCDSNLGLRRVWITLQTLLSHHSWKNNSKFFKLLNKTKKCVWTVLSGYYHNAINLLFKTLFDTGKGGYWLFICTGSAAIEQASPMHFFLGWVGGGGGRGREEEFKIYWQIYEWFFFTA